MDHTNSLESIHPVQTCKLWGSTLHLCSKAFLLQKIRTISETQLVSWALIPLLCILLIWRWLQKPASCKMRHPTLECSHGKRWPVNPHTPPYTWTFCQTIQNATHCQPNPRSLFHPYWQRKSNPHRSPHPKFPPTHTPIGILPWDAFRIGHEPYDSRHKQ